VQSGDAGAVITGGVYATSGGGGAASPKSI